MVTCLERADLLFVMFNCTFVTFLCGIMGQVWYLIVPIPDLCPLFYFYKMSVSKILYSPPKIIRNVKIWNIILLLVFSKYKAQLWM